MSLQPDEAPRRERRVVTSEEKIVADILHGLREKYFPEAEIDIYETGFDDDYVSPNRTEYRAVYYTSEQMDETGSILEDMPNIEHRFELRSGIDLFRVFQGFKQRDSGVLASAKWGEAKQMLYRSFLGSVRCSQPYRELSRAMGEIFQIPGEEQACDPLGYEPPSYSIPVHPRRVDSHLLELLTRPSQSETEREHRQLLERLQQEPWSPERDKRLSLEYTLGPSAACPDGGPEEYDTELRAIVSVNIHFGVAKTLAPQIDSSALATYLPELAE